jgi:nucleoid-associated protein YgaU
VAHVTVDGSGQFALLPPRLGEGSHYLTLQTGPAGATRVISAQSVAVSVAKNGTDKPLVALMSPDQPVRVLSDGAPVAPASQPAATAKANGPATPVAIQTVEAAQGGQFTASGVARAGSQCRLYLNGAFLADVTTGQDGRWSVRIEKGMRPGRYTVRADEIEASSGKVVNRAEVPFDYPAVAELGAGAKRMLVSHLGKPLPPMPAPTATEPAPPATTPPQPVVAAATVRPAPAPSLAGAATALAPSPDPQAVAPVAAAVVPDLQTAKVIRGDSLWRISRKMLGHGVNYTEIYASNASQIRDPRLIYPGQIFVVPNHAVN